MYGQAGLFVGDQRASYSLSGTLCRAANNIRSSSTGHGVPGVVAGLYPSQKHLAWLLCSGNIDDRFGSSQRHLSYAFVRSRCAAPFVIQPSGCK